MVCPVEIFEAVVDETLFAVLSEAGDGEIAAVLLALPLVIDELTNDYVLDHLLPQMPALVHDDDAAVINPLWSDPRTFAPIFVVLAKLFYETVAPVDFPSFPEPRITADPASMFGVRFGGFVDPDGATIEGESMGLFAGSCALAVQSCFRQPVTVALGYMLSSVWRSRPAG